MYESLDNFQAKHYSSMIEIEGNINHFPILILIDSGASYSYVNVNMDKKMQVSK